MLQFPTPPAPEVPAAQIAEADWPPRYEDAAMDGRPLVLALPPALGAVVWRPILTGHAGMRAVHRQGIVPILTRLVVSATEAMIRIDRPLHGRGRFQLARSPGGDRLYLNVWVDVDGVAGRLIPAIPAGDPVGAGQVFAEHVFTRPFGPPEQRKVTRLDVEGFPAVPEAVYDGPAPTAATEPPAGARWLDEAAVPDPGWTVFGLDHTDANQHVNSLVYIRMVTEAALRRFDVHGRRGALLARAVELAYRKPCFAGDRVRVALRAFDAGGVLGAAGTVIADGDPDGRPRAYARVLFG